MNVLRFGGEEEEGGGGRWTRQMDAPAWASARAQAAPMPGKGKEGVSVGIRIFRVCGKARGTRRERRIGTGIGRNEYCLSLDQPFDFERLEVRDGNGFTSAEGYECTSDE